MDTEGPWRPDHCRLTPLDKSPDLTVQQVYTMARHTPGLTAELNMYPQRTFPIPNLHHLLTITVDGRPGVWMELGAIKDLDKHGVPRHWRHHLTYNYGTGRTTTLANHLRIQGVFDFMANAAKR